MKITYRQKQKYGKGFFGTGIQIGYDESDAYVIEQIKAQLIPLGFKFQPSVKFPSGVLKCFFFKDGTLLFGLKTAKENKEFIEQSYPILVKYDPNIEKTVLEYDND
jgi:hypothetical protein